MRLPKEFYTIISDIWPMLTIFIVVLTVMRIIYIIDKGERFQLYKEFFTLMVILYLLLLFGLVTNTDVQSYGNNFTPLKEILRYDFGSKYFIWNVVGNMIMFVPFGLMVSVIFNSKTVGKPLFITLVTSLTIELVQMYIGRSFDVDDILLNCLGGIGGWLLYIGFAAIKRHLPGFLQNDFVYNLLTLILIAIIIITLFNWWGIFIR